MYATFGYMIKLCYRYNVLEANDDTTLENSVFFAGMGRPAHAPFFLRGNIYVNTYERRGCVSDGAEEDGGAAGGLTMEERLRARVKGDKASRKTKMDRDGGDDDDDDDSHADVNSTGGNEGQSRPTLHLTSSSRMKPQIVCIHCGHGFGYQILASGNHEVCLPYYFNVDIIVVMIGINHLVCQIHRTGGLKLGSHRSVSLIDKDGNLSLSFPVFYSA
eukprot:scaffold455590_cov33-Prasinocladus_malaysianus.AAC.1